MTTEKLFRIGLLATGNEITEGEILNLDGQLIAQSLTAQGIPIGLHVIVPDIDLDLQNALRFLLQSHQAIIITGGLGPTSDDRTRYALSEITGKKLEFDETTWQHICQRVQKILGREPHPANRQQALFPQGATIIPNEYGTAAGCYLEHNGQMIYMLPGPPRECMALFEQAVLPHLLTLETDKTIKLSWRLKGVVESDLAALVDAAVKNYPVTTGYRADSPFLDVKIYTQHHAQYDEMLIAIQKIIGPYLFLDQDKK